jgi:uncharacterized OsmC-like protein
MDGMRFLATARAEDSEVRAAHAVVIDAAIEDGGGGTAMSAPQMFVAAIGACMLEFVSNSCRLREIEIARLSLDLTYEELERPRRIGPLDAVLHVEPDIPEADKRRLMGVARRATLVNTLARAPEVTIRWVGA